jgi:hypothetical protein
MAYVPYESLLSIENPDEFEVELKKENERQEDQFRFPSIDSSKKQATVDLLVRKLDACKSGLTDINKDNHGTQLCFRTICSCLCAIKILVRDRDSISVFNNDHLLDLIKEFCGLDEQYYATSASQPTRSRQMQSLDHLNLNDTKLSEELVMTSQKCLTNLIYNNSYAQAHFKQMANALAITVEDFDLNHRQISLFNLRVLFLLTIFNRDVCVRLWNSTDLFEVLTAVLARNANLKIVQRQKLTNEDIELLIETLKLCYNLTIDVNKTGQMREGFESILVGLVGILRELLLLKIDSTYIETSQSKKTKHFQLTDLHSNIVNLLTNMTPVCFEQLLTPATHDEKSQSKTTQARQDYAALDVLLGYLQTSLQNFTSVDRSNQYDPDQMQPLLLSLIMASKSNRSIRKYFRSKILPPLRDEVKKMPSEGLFAFLVELRRKKTYF